MPSTQEMVANYSINETDRKIYLRELVCVRHRKLLLLLLLLLWSTINNNPYSASGGDCPIATDTSDLSHLSFANLELHKALCCPNHGGFGFFLWMSLWVSSCRPGGKAQTFLAACQWNRQITKKHKIEQRFCSPSQGTSSFKCVSPPRTEF